MESASALRAQIEAALADRIPSALTPAPRTMRPVAPVGIDSVDALLEGGLPIGAITEIVGPECSGRTSLALSFVARMTQAGKVCAWIDVLNALDPESAACQGVDLNSLLWVRCGLAASREKRAAEELCFTLPGKYFIPRPTIQGLHGGGCGPHPRGEVKGLSEAVGQFLRPEVKAISGSDSLNRVGHNTEQTGQTEQVDVPRLQSLTYPGRHLPKFARSRSNSEKPWSAIDQALRVTDLLLQAGGFGAVVLDLAGVAPQHVLRVPLATWFRYRAAAERGQTSIVLLTQHACAKSSAGLVLDLHQGCDMHEERTIFGGMKHRVEVMRERFKAEVNVIPLRKPPQSERGARWQSRNPWAGVR